MTDGPWESVTYESMSRDELHAHGFLREGKGVSVMHCHAGGNVHHQHGVEPTVLAAVDHSMPTRYLDECDFEYHAVMTREGDRDS